MFEAETTKVDVKKVEQSVLEFWRDNRVFEQSMKRREGAKKWVTYEGPPTVNGNPGEHHVLARAFNDMFPAVQDDARTLRAAQGRVGHTRLAG